MANTQDRQSKQNDQGFDRPDSLSGSRGQGGSSPEGFPGSTTSTPPTGGVGTPEKFPGSTASSTGGAATAAARSLIEQAKETAGQAYEAVTEKAATKLDEQKSTLSGGLATVADSVRQVGDNLGSAKTDSGLAESAAKYTHTAAEKIENVAGYFETTNVREMARDLEDFARRNPIVFFGAAFGLGLLAARFLKSTSPRQFDAGAGGSFGTESGDRRLRAGTKSPGGDSTKNTTSAPDSIAKPL